MQREKEARERMSVMEDEKEGNGSFGEVIMRYLWARERERE
jgi:predicted CopG family antitoxin